MESGKVTKIFNKIINFFVQWEYFHRAMQGPGDLWSIKIIIILACDDTLLIKVHTFISSR